MHERSAVRAREGTGYDAALAALLEATEAIATAVESHDRVALEAANGRADRLVDQLAALTAGLSAIERAAVGDPTSRTHALALRLRAAGRRNALLIERAWALDAATTRLLAGLVSGDVHALPLYAGMAPVAVERRA